MNEYFVKIYCFFSVQGTTLDSQVEMYIVNTSFIQQI